MTYKGWYAIKTNQTKIVLLMTTKWHDQSVAGMHRSAQERCVRASAGHTFKDDTTEWQQKGTHWIGQTIQLARWMADQNKLRCAPHKLYFIKVIANHGVNNELYQHS